MNRLTRGLFIGTLVGSAVGLMMLIRKRQGMMDSSDQVTRVTRRSRNAMRMVKDKAHRWTSAVKSGSEAFTDKLARRPT